MVGDGVNKNSLNILEGKRTKFKLTYSMGGKVSQRINQNSLILQ
jgi:hypothetical protein